MEETAREEREREKEDDHMLVREGLVLAESLLVAKIKPCFGRVLQTKHIHLQTAFQLKFISMCKISVLFPCLVTNILI